MTIVEFGHVSPRQLRESSHNDPMHPKSHEPLDISGRLGPMLKAICAKGLIFIRFR